MILVDKIKQRASRKNTLVFLIIALVTFVLIGAVAMAMMDQSGILAFLDMRFFYTFDDVTEYLTALGETGRTYFIYQKIIDSFFPIGYGLGIALALGYIFRMRDIKSPWHSIILIPIIAAIFDYLENILLTTQIVSFPNISEVIVSIAAIITLIKWIFLLSSIVLLFVAVLIFVVKKRTPDSQNSEP